MKIQKTKDGNIYLSILHGKAAIRPDEVNLLLAEINYTTLSLTDGSKIIISYTLKKFEETLPAKEFIRPNRSLLVNIRYIKTLTNREVILKDNTRIPIARRRVSALATAIENFNKETGYRE